MNFSEAFCLTVRLSINDKADVTLSVQPSLFRTVFCDLCKTQRNKQRFQLFNTFAIRRCVFHKFESIRA